MALATNVNPSTHGVDIDSHTPLLCVSRGIVPAIANAIFQEATGP